jgi:hypothetical protein
MKNPIVQSVADAVNRVRNTPIDLYPPIRRKGGTGGRMEPSSFCFDKIKGDKFYIKGGNVSWSGRDPVIVPDCFVVVSADGWVVLRLDVETMAVTIEFSSVYPVDGGGFMWYPLYAVTCTSGVVRKGPSCRTDWIIRSPI